MLQNNQDIQFDGHTYNHLQDSLRLHRQLGKVWNVVKNGAWFTLREIADLIGAPEASVSARLRDLRKPKFGSNTVEREYIGQGLYRYRLISGNAAKVSSEEIGQVRHGAQAVTRH